VSKPPSGVELVVEGLTIRFGGLTAVDGMSFEVRPGEVLSLIGPNGAGKTSAFNAITGYVEPSGGTIAYRGSRLNGLKPNQVAELGVVRTFQKTSVFMGQSAVDNVLIGLHLVSRQRPLAIIFGFPSVAREEKELVQEAQRILVHGRDVPAFEPDVSRARFDQPQHAAPGGGFSAPGLAHQAERLAGIDMEADTVDRSHVVDLARKEASLHREVLDQVFHAQQRLGHGHPW